MFVSEYNAYCCIHELLWMFHLFKDVVHVAVTGSLFKLLYVLQCTYSYGLQIATVLAARLSSVLTCKDHDV